MNKNNIFVYIIMSISVILASCGNKVSADINDYNVQMQDVQSEEKKLVNEIDKLGLDKADQLLGAEVTEEKKKKLKSIEQSIEKKIKPQLETYEKKVKKIKPETSDVQEVHNIYKQNLSKKKQFIKNLDQYMKLFNQSIVTNEKILKYTEVFEKNKSLSEKYAGKVGNDQKAIKEFEALNKVIRENSDALKEKIEYLSNDKPVKAKQQYIEKTLIPFIQSNVDKLNRTKITDKNVTAVRQATIEIYYSLINYYKERKVAMDIEAKLQKMPIQDILQNTKYIQTIDEKYYEALRKLEEQNK
ncbi:EMYY motif lipoprotein [Macrococcus armenti]|uniref:EMYY motif lipoprotein n=1 Tax=Macrococcus armenti TaxID=2875764 RepID=UPI001CCADF00|nr:EMYY motif lipoprotein [Macrococcus armenti]UBH09151.1 EMYY motif lipoprotein [Macrococcus armenti]UBH11446.1 EMYY motif lipoprotein [Macrococcus armenti]UBH15927.1 EMYY motif lipoprotein [Macrococcus armenti]UBH18288.1 EMYY motif lipoprotein [Macrococcus armenti]UBH20554.1 EMYY motif lipoprotein [Macrococcus armenti]